MTDTKNQSDYQCITTYNTVNTLHIKKGLCMSIEYYSTEGLILNL